MSAVQDPGDSSEPSVEAVGLTKSYPGRRSFFGRSESPSMVAVDRVDISLAEGEIFGLVGPNGAGKTTLIKLLTTLLRPTSGHASVGGLDVVKDEYQIRRTVGLVTSNERSFYWRLTGRQNLRFFASLYDLPAREAEVWIDELFELLGLSEQADRRFDAYSTGMKQRLSFARGLLTKPRFLFMDEPTKGVDPASRADIIHIIQERIIERWKPTILITSHNLSEIEVLCGRIALMQKGRFVAVGTLDELRTLAHPVDRYDVRVSKLEATRLRELAAGCGAEQAQPRPSANGHERLSVTFPQGTDGFSRFVRGVVEAGGDVVTCSSVVDSLDDVFQKLLDKHAADEKAPGGKVPAGQAPGEPAKEVR